MKLEFDSISELEQFLMFSAHIGKAFAVAPVSEPVQRVDPAADFYVAPEAAYHATISAQTEATLAAIPPAQDKIDTQEEDIAKEFATKRKRRTKAEMEAERAAGGPPHSPAGG